MLSGHIENSGPPFVFGEEETGGLNRGITVVSDELRQDQAARFYHLADLAAGQRFYAYAEAISGDVKPVLTLFDQSDKPVAYANFTATDERARMEYQLPWKAERYRLRISSQDPTGKATAGRFRLLIGLNAPEVLKGKGEPHRHRSNPDQTTWSPQDRHPARRRQPALPPLGRVTDTASAGAGDAPLPADQTVEEAVA